VGDSKSKSPYEDSKSHSDEQIIAATVGERKPLNSNIYLAANNSAWPTFFIRLRDQITEVLGEKILQLEHVGSTAVPDLPAKPIIDMVMEVADSSDE